MSTPGPAKPSVLKRKPKAVARRSATEREEANRREEERRIAKEQAARDEAKLEADQRKIQYGFFEERGRGRGRGNAQRGRGGRGGFMGDQGQPASQLSGLGVFGGQESERRHWMERAHDGGREDVGGRARGSGRGVAREGDAVAGGSHGTGRGRRAGEQPDPNAAAPVARMAASSAADRWAGSDVEMADRPSIARPKKDKIKEESDEDAFSADEDADEAIDMEKLNLMQSGDSGLLPVTVDRVEHVERQFYINTNSSAAVAASKRGSKRRGLEFEDIIKAEPDDDEDAAPEATPAVKEEPPSSPETGKKSKRYPRASRTKSAAPPQPRTMEQIIQERNRRILLGELGPVQPQSAVKGADSEDVDRTEEQSFNPRQDALFLFQFPPRLPPMTQRGVKVKAEPKDESADLDPINHVEPAAEDETKVKQEDPGGPLLAAEDKSNCKTELQPGFVGKMQVWKSGKVTLDWGGVRMMVRKGYDSSFVETVVAMSLKAKRRGSENIPGEYEGVAHSFGQVRGKMVVTPDYGAILGLEKKGR